MGWKKGKPRSEKTKKKQSLALKGRPHTFEHNKKVSLSLKGYKKTKEHIRKIAEGNIGKIVSKETRIKMSIARKGKKIHSLKARMIMSEQKKGKNNPNWKGGIYPANKLIRDSIKYRLWRASVFERDNFTCQKCKKLGGQLEADHIKSFSDYPELRFVIENGRTLCKKCHTKTDNYGWRIVNKNKSYAKK